MNRCAAFTLIELMVSIAIASILFLGMSSAMMIASQAIPDAEGVTHNTITAAQAVEQFAAELQYAVAINDSTDTMVEFTVADRNADDIPETIRYQWSGMTGDSLIRQYNGGTLAEMLTDVHQFGLSYDLQPTTTEIPQGNESAETTLASYNSDADQNVLDIKSDRWYSQRFLPSLPAQTISWKITRVGFYAAVKNAIDGQCKVQLRLATSGGVPTGIVLEEKTLLESTLKSQWRLQQFSFTNVTELPPGQNVCIVLEWVAGTEACQILIRGNNVPAPNPAYMRSSDQGISWMAYPNQSLLYSVYGTVTTEGQPKIETTYNLTGVNLTLQKHDDARGIIHAGVQLLNGPEVMY